MSQTKRLSKKVEPIEITQELRNKEVSTVIKIFELTNELIEKKLCGFDLTLKNGWKVSCRNKRFAKQMEVPMP